MPSGPADEASLQAPHAPDATAPGPVGSHFACLEGIRALAAGLVVLHHAASLVGPVRASILGTPAAVTDIGVSIFFVLSGFLIYRPFARAHLAGSAPLRARTFWWRRLVRIVPAYWLALSVMWATGILHLGPQWWRYYLFLQVYGVFTSLGGIVPGWSLDTEMVFYLFIPLWSLVLRRVVYRNKPARPAVLEVLAIGLLGASGYVSRELFTHSRRVWLALPGHAPVTMREISFTWFPNNVDLFAAGMAVAALSVWAAQDDALRRRLQRIGAPAAAWWTVAMVLFAWFAYRVGPAPAVGYEGWYWQQRQFVFAVIGVCLVIPAVFGDEQRGRLRRFLQWRPVVWLGTVSYGLYLWHLNLMEELPVWFHRPPTSFPVLVAVAAAFVLGTAAAAASWYGVERPVQRFAKRLL